MRKRVVAIAFFVVAGSIGAGVAASAHAGDVQPQASCSLPGAVPCLDDSTCSPYGATCDVLQGQCICAAAADLGMDLAPAPPGVDLMPTPTGTDGGISAGAPPVGGGMTSPPKSAGCSFVPGSL